MQLNKYFSLHHIVLTGVLLLSSLMLSAQNPITIANAETKALNLIKITEPVRDIQTSHDGVVVKTPKLGYHPKNDWPLHEITNKDALPNGADPAWQKEYSPSNTQRVLIKDWEGMGPDGTFNPGDPSLDVGPNHVVQMVNGVGGSNVEIWDKNGNSLANFIFDGVTGISGAGDPIVIYDQLADRWLLSEFAPQGANALIVGISTTPDPTGTYAIYSFSTPDFPDYPKYSIWNDAYIVTTNESNSRIYAFDRVKMLAGDPTATAQQFDITNFSTIGFQAATPVNLDGTMLPPTGAPGMFMRMADDGWTGVTEDRLEMFEMTLDFANAANSSITGPIMLPTDPFDTELNGFTAFSAIAQPGTSLELDPLRELLMNKIIYRNFGSYEALVCNHVTDVTGNDDAGIRWYELRRVGGTSSSWTIYQQGTYSPDNTSRWMASIGINEDGSIGLAYNVSDATSVFPGLRYTGRKECDPLGDMTYPETTIVDGSAANSSNRYGDYNTLSVDPVDGTFWFTGQYNPTSTWATRVANFEIPFDCFGIKLTAVDLAQTICQPMDAAYDFDMEFLGGFTGSVNFSTTGLPAGATATFDTNPSTAAGTFTMTVGNTAAAAPGTYSITITATDGTETDDITVDLTIDGQISTAATLASPADNTIGESTTPVFTWAAVAGASAYTIEIATDASFSTIIETATITQTTYTGGPLAITTEFYWRVTSENSCGAGPTSSVFTFETANISCASYPSTDTPITISQSGTPTITSSIVITDAGNITDLNILNMDISHTYSGDLTITLMSPTGTSVVLVSGLCGTDEDIMGNFDDAGVALPCPMTGGTFMPQNPFAAFNTESITGTWVLTIEDSANLDGGSLNGWTLELCGNLAPPVCPTSAPTLIDPADMAVSVVTNPTYTWTALADATSYIIEIATDAAFTNIIETSTTTNPTFTGTVVLNAMTTYYWRVTGTNVCGPGPTSTPFSFSTESCVTYNSTDTPIAIPKSMPPVMVSSTITVAGTGFISDLNVLNLDIQHDNVADLEVTLEHVETGTTVIILSEICLDDTSITGSFDDAGTAIVCPPNGGVYSPQEPFSSFIGEAVAGTWVLSISDLYFKDGGTLESWSLEICGDYIPTSCPPDYANGNELIGLQSIDADYETDGAIESSQLVDNNSIVDYDSGVSVLLKEDFEVIIGTTFHAFIDGCDGAMLQAGKTNIGSK